MHLHKHIQDLLLVQQLSCYPGASTMQLALTVGGRGTSGALPGPTAVSISKTPRAAEKNSQAAEKNSQQKNPLEAIQRGEATSDLGGV